MPYGGDGTLHQQKSQEQWGGPLHNCLQDARVDILKVSKHCRSQNKNRGNHFKSNRIDDHIVAPFPLITNKVTPIIDPIGNQVKLIVLIWH
jgi:hypothetical protein